MRRIFSALDIGSKYIKLVVGEFFNGKLNILCAIKGDSQGFRLNQITDPERLEKSINKVLDEANSKLNFKIKKVIVNIPTDYNEFVITESSLDLDEDNNVVTSEDILKVLQKASNNQTKVNDEIIANIPVMFKVGDLETNAPLNKKGKKLSVKSVLVITDKTRIYDLVKVLEKCELEVVDITTTGLVDYYNFKDNDIDSKNSIIVNMGATTTNISVFSKGIYINNISLDMGSEDLDKEIMTHYGIRRKDAIYLKENLVILDDKKTDIKQVIPIVSNNGTEININEEDVSKVAIKKIEEMLNSIKKNINYLTKKEISYIIITGGLTEIKDITILLQKVFGNKVRLGKINEIGARDNAFSTAVGMLKYFNSKLNLRGKDYSMLSDDDLELMISNNSKVGPNGDNIFGKVFSYFFDN